MVRLLIPSIHFKRSYLAALKEYHSDEGFLTDKIDYEEVAKDFAAYIKKIKSRRQGEGLPIGYVPESEFWLIAGDDYVGTVKVRHRLNDALREVGGHIGYYIRPPKRGRGYGKKILGLALKKARALGIKKVLITCDETNIGSRKIIEANGGMLENIVPTGKGKPSKMRFWID